MKPLKLLSHKSVERRRPSQAAIKIYMYYVGDLVTYNYAVVVFSHDIVRIEKNLSGDVPPAPRRVP